MCKNRLEYVTDILLNTYSTKPVNSSIPIEGLIFKVFKCLGCDHAELFIKNSDNGELTK